MLYLRLFLEFFRTGLLAVGGGMATVPFLMDIGSRTGWFLASDLADMIAVSESTPGPIGVNMATYVGFTTAGPLGALIATLGLITPCVIIILIIAGLLDKFSEKPIVKAVFRVLRAAVVGLISYALFTVAKLTFLTESGSLNLICIICYAVLLVLILKFKKIHPLAFVALGALFGIIVL